MPEQTALDLESPADARERALAGWRADPLGQFATWRRATTASNGYAYSDRSLAQHQAMWGHFVESMAAAGRHPLDADAGRIERFLLGLRGIRRKDRTRATRPPSDAASTITLRRYLQLLADTYEQLGRLGVVADNPVKPLMPVYGKPEAPPIVSYLSAGQEAALIARIVAMPTGAWREQRDGAILATLLGCGPTVSELLALSVDDLQLDDYAPAVQIASAGLTHGHTAPIAEFARPLLAAWHARRLREPLDGDLLFPAAQSGRPLSAVSVYQLVRDALDAIGFAGRHRGPQTLRNTFARRQLFHGVDAQQLQGWLGLETSRTLDKLRRTLPGTWDSGVS